MPFRLSSSMTRLHHECIAAGQQRARSWIWKPGLGDLARASSGSYVHPDRWSLYHETTRSCLAILSRTHGQRTMRPVEIWCNHPTLVRESTNFASVRMYAITDPCYTERSVRWENYKDYLFVFSMHRMKCLLIASYRGQSAHFKAISPRNIFLGFMAWT